MTPYRIKDVTRINRSSLPEDTDPDYRFRYVDISAVDELGNVTIPGEDTSFGSAPSRARRLAPAGTVIVSTIRTYLRAIATVPNSEEPLVFSTGFAALEAQPKVDSRFLAYYCHSQPFIDNVVARSVGVSYPAINASDIGSLSIPVPSLEEQRHIADFLDAKTAHIDLLRRRRRQQIDLLGDSEASVVNDYLQSSEGKSTRVKHLSTKITSGPRGWGDLASEQGSLFLRITNIPRRGIDLDLRDSLYVAAPAGHERERSRTQTGDVLVSITADIGSVAIVDCRAVDGNISQHIALVRPDRETCDPSWLAYVIKSVKSNQRLRMSSYGGTKVGLGLGDVANLSVEVPDLTTQKDRASQVSKVLAEREKLRSRIAAQHHLLAERRQALITAAVTGQFDVTSASGRGITEGVSS